MGASFLFFVFCFHIVNFRLYWLYPKWNVLHPIAHGISFVACRGSFIWATWTQHARRSCRCSGCESFTVVQPSQNNMQDCKYIPCFILFLSYAPPPPKYSNREWIQTSIVCFKSFWLLFKVWVIRTFVVQLSRRTVELFAWVLFSLCSKLANFCPSALFNILQCPLTANASCGSRLLGIWVEIQTRVGRRRLYAIFYGNSNTMKGRKSLLKVFPTTAAKVFFALPTLQFNISSNKKLLGTLQISCS